MDFDSTVDSDISSEIKMSSSKQVYVATVLGGPFAGGWLLFQNLISNDDKKKANLVLIGTLLIFFALLFVSYQLPTGASSIALPLLVAILYMVIYKLTFDHHFLKHIKNNGLITSWWSVLGVSLISLVISLILMFSVSYGLVTNSSDAEIIDEQYPSLKEMVVSLDAIPTILNEVRLSQTEGTFAVFAFSDSENSSEALNIQFSFENGQVGLDWVLMGSSNIRDRRKYEEYLKQLNVDFQLKTKNGVDYLRTVGGDLAVVCKKVIVEMYGTNPKEMIEVYYLGIKLERYLTK